MGMMRVLTCENILRVERTGEENWDGENGKLSMMNLVRRYTMIYEVEGENVETPKKRKKYEQ